MSEEFGPYRLDEMLGRGGMGRVYRAVDRRKGREVALKVIAEDVATEPESRRRFLREAELSARLAHPHVVPVHDYGEIDGRLFIEMSLVEGGNLAALLADGRRLDPHRAVTMIEQVASALGAAHDRGVVHRDVKPANMLTAWLTERGDPSDFLYLTDFGIAQAATGLGSTRLTGTGMVIGTMTYMAPECFSSARVDHRADVYALACVLYEMLTGRPPVTAESQAALMYRIVDGRIEPCAGIEPAVPEALSEALSTALAKDPLRRPAGMRDFATTARRALGAPDGPETSRRAVRATRRRLGLSFCARSDRGLEQPSNHDAVYVGPRLLVLADGGAQRTNGDVSSKLVVAAMVPLDDDEPGEDPLAELAEAVSRGNDAIAGLRDEEPGPERGTTVTGLLFDGRSFSLVHYGNSRAYRRRDGRVEQLTSDDMRHSSWRARADYLQDSVVLAGDDASVALTKYRARVGDRMLLCTDGLHQFVREDTLVEALDIADPQQCGDRCIELALEAGGGDNITVVVADVVALPA